MIIIAILVVLFLILFIHHITIRRNDPPGPMGIPILGNFPKKLLDTFLTKNNDKSNKMYRFKELRDKYGPMWSLRMGNIRIVVLASTDLLVEAFTRNEELFSGRPIQEMYSWFGGRRGLIFSDGETWRGNRQLALKSLKDLGMGKKYMEMYINDESNELIRYLREIRSEQINVPEEITKGVVNIILRLVFNNRHSYKDTVMMEYVRNVYFLTHSGVPDKYISLSPRMTQWTVVQNLLPTVKRYYETFYATKNFVFDKCFDKLKDVDYSEESKCVFDNFIKNRYSNNEDYIETEEKEPANEKLTDDQLTEICFCMFDLFNAGTDTTSNMIHYSMLMLGKDEQLQQELRNELNEQIADIEALTMATRKNCPKLLSFLDEIFRYCLLVPHLHHRAIAHCELAGFKIRPDDIVIGDLYSTFRDPNNFENPNQFIPFRFLDSDGKYEPNKNLIQFGIGKRSCIGESLALMELFMFLSKIIKSFNISLPSTTLKNFDEIISGEFGIVHAPLFHDVTLENL